MNLVDATAVYKGSTETKAVYYGGKKIWSLQNWLPSGILNNIVGFYGLNDNGAGALSLADTSGQNNSLTNINGVQLTSGKIAGGADFTTNQYLRALPQNSFQLSASYTFSMWVYVSAFKNYFCLVGGNRVGATSGTIAIYGDQLGALHINDGVAEDVKIDNFFELNTWLHCVIKRRYWVLPGQTLQEFFIYKNGSLLSTENSILSANSYNSSELYFGSFPGRSSEDFQFLGKMDAIGLWSDLVSDSHIMSLYNAGSAFEISTD